MLNVESEIAQRAVFVDDFLSKHLEVYSSEDYFVPKTLLHSMSYSLQNGGKKFRPVLALIVAEHYHQDPMQVLPWAAAVEMVHTYSLIHDDLPCMDDDDFRRGQPTNHKVYGEAVALLAGDGLLTEAFQVLVKYYSATDPSLACQLIDKLGWAAGAHGMVGGQVLDLQAQKRQPSADELKQIQKMKTGRLIRVALEGAAVICQAPQNDVLALKFYGESLGLAFQMADDLLDHQQQEEGKSFVSSLGFEETETLLAQTSVKAKEYLNKLTIPNALLLQIVDYNLQRKK